MKVDHAADVERHAPRAGGLSHLLDGGAALLDRSLRTLPLAGVELGECKVGESLGAPAVLTPIAVPLVLNSVTGSCCFGLVHAGEPDETDAIPLDVGPRPLLETERPLDEVVRCAMPELGAEERLVQKNRGEQRGVIVFVEKLGCGVGVFQHAHVIEEGVFGQLCVDAATQAVVISRLSQSSL